MSSSTLISIDFSLAILSGRPTAATIQAALNDLPTIAPLSVSVTATSTLYMITFPADMDDVPLLTCISTSTNAPIVTEVVPGIGSGSKAAFAFDGQFTDYMDLSSNMTQAAISQMINNAFSIQCPPSINDATITKSIVYAQDFETNCVYDETPITTSAFCGQCSLNGNSLVSNNNASGNYLCFAYRILNKYVNSINFGIQVNGDTTSTTWPSLAFSPRADKQWHYVCVDVFNGLRSQSSIGSTATSIVITNAWLSNYVRKGIFIDAVTVRNALPTGYEDITQYPIDQSSNGLCVFPFTYNGKTYTACTLDNNNMPICGDNNNNTYQCRSSSIEGVRRLFPQHQLSYNTLQVTYTPSSSQIAVSFRYSDCSAPSLITSSPSSVRFSSLSSLIIYSFY